MDNISDYLLSSFNDALQNEYIQVYYQPVIRTITGQVCNFEALARWVDPEYGVIPPVEFIELLEHNKLIHQLDSYVINQVCKRIRGDINLGFQPVPISINLSRLDFELCNIFEVVNQAVSNYRLPRNYLYIEITESMFSDKPELMHMVIQKFRDSGYQVWMDDFGSGYSSLNVLKDYYFDELKVDMGFLSTFHLQSRKILTSVIDMAKNIGLHTLVEGVETDEQYQFLRDIGCEKVQGYLFGRPMPYNDAMEHLREAGIKLESPSMRDYYDAIGNINVLSAVPFMSNERRNKLSSARELSSIPLALLEVQGDNMRFLFCNVSFEEAIEEMNWKDIVSRENNGITFESSKLPYRIVGMFEDARKNKSASIYFVSNNEYYEASAQYVAEAHGVYCLLIRIQNLSKEYGFTRAGALDTDLRYIYSAYDSFAIFDLVKNKFSLLYIGPHDENTQDENLDKVLNAYLTNEIFTEDFGGFKDFYNLDTLEKRIRDSHKNYITEFFRTRDTRGNYIWKQYVCIGCEPGYVLSLIREATQDIMSIRKHFTDLYPIKPFDAITDGRLWKSFVQSNLPLTYWKDTDLKYVGASYGLLDFLGAKLEDIEGKTDQEIGWHISIGDIAKIESMVITDGVSIDNISIEYISNGNTIQALLGITPIYNEYGSIVGLIGSLKRVRDESGNPFNKDYNRLDELTGLLNERGISEELAFYCDMYYLKNKDFVRIHLNIDDYDTITALYDNEHGENLIKNIGRQLSESFGKNAVIGRVRGHSFVILKQYNDESDLINIVHDIDTFNSQISKDTSFSNGIYLSTGMCTFFECKDIFRQEQIADTRMEDDHNRHVSVGDKYPYGGKLFSAFNKLPLSFAVYDIKINQDNKVEAYFYYVNERFALEQNKKPEDLVGKKVSEVFDDLEQEWYDIAYQAAFLSKEFSIDEIYFKCMNTNYLMTASQIMRPGFCVFTYQPLDGPFAMKF